MDAERAFGHRLSAQRHLLDLSQDEPARRAGCAIATIRQIEQGNRKPSKQLAERLADVLLVPTEERVRFINELRGLNIQNLPDSSLQITTLPTGNVTFLFSDIEASTTRWKQHPKAMREALI